MGSKVLVVDDDISHLKLVEAILLGAGYTVQTLGDSSQAMEKMASFMPDIFIVDLMMPQTDGFALIRDVRANKEYDFIKILVLSAKAFSYDQGRAYELGANAYVTKPIDAAKFREQVKAILRNEIKVTFWGTRGTVPTPYKDFLEYGGNTSCVSVEFSEGRLFIFDAGTGIIRLGDYLLGQKKRTKINLLVSHPHWDHIHGLPFFKPAFIQGNEIAIYGTAHGDLSMREVMSGQMESIYFPITIREYAARLYFKELWEGEYLIEGIRLQTILLNHPGNTLGYKLSCANGKSVAYITDNELVPENLGPRDPHFRGKLVQFLKDVDLLIHDSSYFDDEYESRIGWGHPPLSELLQLVKEANVKNLYMFHHDPGHNDEKVAEKERFAKAFIKEHNLDIQCFAAREGVTVTLK